MLPQWLPALVKNGRYQFLFVLADYKIDFVYFQNNAFKRHLAPIIVRDFRKWSRKAASHSFSILFTIIHTQSRRFPNTSLWVTTSPTPSLCGAYLEKSSICKKQPAIMKAITLAKNVILLVVYSPLVCLLSFVKSTDLCWRIWSSGPCCTCRCSNWIACPSFRRGFGWL